MSSKEKIQDKEDLKQEDSVAVGQEQSLLQTSNQETAAPASTDIVTPSTDQTTSASEQSLPINDASVDNTAPATEQGQENTEQNADEATTESPNVENNSPVPEGGEQSSEQDGLSSMGGGEVPPLSYENSSKDERKQFEQRKEIIAGVKKNSNETKTDSASQKPPEISYRYIGDLDKGSIKQALIMFEEFDRAIALGNKTEMGIVNTTYYKHSDNGNLNRLNVNLPIRKFFSSTAKTPEQAKEIYLQCRLDLINQYLLTETANFESLTDAIGNSTMRGVHSVLNLPNLLSTIDNVKKLNRFSNYRKRLDNNESYKSIVDVKSRSKQRNNAYRHNQYVVDHSDFERSSFNEEDAKQLYEKAEAEVIKEFRSSVILSAYRNKIKNGYTQSFVVDRVKNAPNTDEMWREINRAPWLYYASTLPEGFIEALPGDAAAVAAGFLTGPVGAAGTKIAYDYTLNFTNHFFDFVSRAGYNIENEDELKKALDNEILVKAALDSAENYAVLQTATGFLMGKAGDGIKFFSGNMAKNLGVNELGQVLSGKLASKIIETPVKQEVDHGIHKILR